MLPVDAYFPERGIVVEYYDQHEEAVTFFDKPDQLTVSGVHRGAQRRRMTSDAWKRSHATACGWRSSARRRSTATPAAAFGEHAHRRRSSAQAA
jgi:hypothetical protein